MRYNINTRGGVKWGKVVPSGKYQKGGPAMTLVFRHNLDAKNRIFIPAKFREELGTEFVIAANLHPGVHCLNIYTVEEWEKYIRPIMEKPRVEAEKILRKLNRLATRVTPDSQGRVLLPESLTAYIGAGGEDREMVINGCGFYAEIWTAKAYDEMLAEEDSDEIAATLLSYGM